MATSLNTSEHAGPSGVGRFGAGLTEAEVAKFQAILSEHCGVEVGMREAWSRAIELLSLVETLLQSQGAFPPKEEESTEFALPRS